MNRSDLVAFARNSIAKGSKSFALASRLFDHQTREHVWLLYAWARKCDDMADGQDHGGTMSDMPDPAERLQTIRRLTTKAMNGKTTGEPAFDALRIVAAECGITQKMVEHVIKGFALDSANWRPRSEDDLYQYCYHVAGAVGVMVAAIMGVDPNDKATLNRASDLGIAFQLANIARDISEDDAAGRCYLPLNWLAEMDIPPDQHMKPHYRERLTLMAKRLCDAAGIYKNSAPIGAAALPFRCRWALLSAAGIYGDIAQKVHKAGDHAWDQRIYVGKVEKLGWVMKAFFQAAINKPEITSRDGLWTRT